MAARTDDINKKTDKLASENPRRGKEMVQYNEVENQLQQINAERMNNLALEKQDLGTEAQMTETLSQAGAMAAMSGGGGAAAATLAPSTQETLGKYGYVGKPSVQRTSTRDVRIQPNNITINNTTNTTTTNNINAGPLQGRSVQIAQPQGGSVEAQGQAKFKTWLTNLFAQQKEANIKRSREYEKREWSLTRSANKMLRKMQDVGKDVMGTFNPKNIGTTVGNQMRVLLMLFGIKFLAKNFDRIVEIGTGVYRWVRDAVKFFGIGEDGRRLVANGGGFRGELIKFLGGDPKNPKTTLMSVLKDIFSELSDHIKLYFEKQMALRGMAMKAVKFPDLKLDTSSSGLPGWASRLISGLGGVFTKAFSGVTTYLGDILTALVDPKAGVQRSIKTEINRVGEQESTTARYRDGEPNMFKNHGDVNAGDHALIEKGENGQRKYSLLANALDSSGQLQNTAGASISQGRDILGAMNDAAKYGRYDVARLTSGLSRLEESAARNGQVTVDREFLDKIYGPTNSERLIQSGQIKKVRMKFVEEDMSERDKYLEQQYANRTYGDRTFLGDAARKGAAISRAMWNYLATDKSFGETFSQFIDDSVSDPMVGAYQSFRRGREYRDKKLVLVPYDDPRPAAAINGRTTKDGVYYQLTPEALRWLATNIFKSNGFNPSDQTFISGATFKLGQAGGGQAEMNRKWNLRGKDQFKSQYDIDLSDKFKELQHLTNLERAYDDRLANDAWSRRTAVIGNNAARLGNSVVNWAGDALGAGARMLGLGGSVKRITRAESKKNALYIMNDLVRRGLSPHQAAGIVGNLMAESGLNPSSNAIDTNGLRAGGLAAWNGPLWHGLHQFAKQQGKPWNNIDLQLDYLWSLLCRDNKQMNDVRARLKKAQTPYDASDAWAYYERYAGYNYDPRTARQAGWSPARIQKEHDNRGANANGVMALWNEANSQEGGISSYLSQYPSGGFSGQVGDVSSAPNFTSGNVVSGGSSVSLPSYTTTYLAGSVAQISMQGVLEQRGEGQQSPVGIEYSGDGTKPTGAMVALVGDSYAVGMAPHFIKYVGEKGLTAKASSWPGGSNPKNNYYCVSGATIDAIAKQSKNAVNDKAAVIVIHAGLNNAGQDESTISSKLLACGKVASSGGAKVFLVAPITNQPGKFNTESNSGNAKKVANAVRAACKAGGFGLIDLEPSSGKYTYSKDKEGIHPDQYSSLAKDIVELLWRGGGMASSVAVKAEEQERGLIDGGSLNEVGGYYVPGGEYSPENGIGDALHNVSDEWSSAQPFGAKSDAEMARATEASRLIDEASKLWIDADTNRISLLDSSGNVISDEKEFVRAYINQSPKAREEWRRQITGITESRYLWDTFDSDFAKTHLGGIDKKKFKNWYRGLSDEDRENAKYQIRMIQNGQAGYDDWRSQFSKEELINMARSVNALNVNGGIDSGALWGVYRSVLNGNFDQRSNLTQEQRNFAASIRDREGFANLTKQIKDLENKVQSADNYEDRTDRQFELDRLKYQRASLGRKNILSKAGDDLAAVGRINKSNKEIGNIDKKLAEIEYNKANFRKYFNASTRNMKDLTDEELLKLADQMWEELLKQEKETSEHLEKLTGLSKDKVEAYRKEVQKNAEIRAKHEEFVQQSAVDLQKEFDKLSKNGEDYLNGVLKMFEKYGQDALKFLGLTLSDLEKSYKRTSDLMYDKLNGWQQEMDIDTDLKLGKITKEEADALRKKARQKRQKEMFDSLDKGRINLDIKGALETGRSVFVPEKSDAASRATKQAKKEETEKSSSVSLIVDEAPSGRGWLKGWAAGGWTPNGPVNTPFQFDEGGDVFHSGEYVIPKYLAQLPEVRADIDKWERYRTSTIAGQKTADGKMKEPVDFTGQMIGRQEITNELLALIARSNAKGFSSVADVIASSKNRDNIPMGVKQVNNHKHIYE